MTQTIPREWAHRAPAQRAILWLGWFALVALFVWCWQIMSKDTIWAFVWDAPDQAMDIGSRMMPPKWGFLPQLMKPLWDNLNMATLGTIGGVIIAIPQGRGALPIAWARARPMSRGKTVGTPVFRAKMQKN